MSQSTCLTSLSTAASERSGTSRSIEWIVLALVLAGALLRFYRLGAQSLWVDELLTVKAANLGGSLTGPDLFANIQGPLHAAIVHAVGAVSRSEFALRSASALAGVAQIPVAFVLGRELAGRRAGLVAALLTTVSPFAVWYSQELRNYSMLILFSGLSTIMAWRLVFKEGRSWAAYGVVTLCALLSNFAAGFLLVAQNLAAAPRVFSDGRFARRWIVTQVVVLLLFAPWIWGLAGWVAVDEVGERVVVGRRAEPAELLRGDTTFSPLALPYAVYVMGYGYSLGPGAEELHTGSPLKAYAGHAGHVVPAAAVYGVALVLGAWTLVRDRRKALFAALIVGIPFAGASLLAAANVKPFNPRYVSVALPMLTVLAAAGVVRLKRIPGAAVCLLLVVFSAASLVNYYGRPEYSREDVRSAARYVEAHEESGDIILVPVVKDVFEFYYAGGSERFLLYPGQAGSDDEVAGRLRDGLNGAGRVWFVNARLWHADPDRRIPAWLEGNLTALERVSFAGASVVLFDADTGAHGAGL